MMRVGQCIRFHRGRFVWTVTDSEMGFGLGPGETVMVLESSRASDPNRWRLKILTASGKVGILGVYAGENDLEVLSHDEQ